MIDHQRAGREFIAKIEPKSHYLLNKEEKVFL